MRGHRGADAIVGRVLGGLGSAALRWRQLLAENPADPAAAASLVEGVKQSAQFFGRLFGGDGCGGDDDSCDGGAGISRALGRRDFATARPLWQQRQYTLVSGRLLALLQRPDLQLGGGGEAGGQPRPAPAYSPVLLLALGRLLQAAPAEVRRQDRARMLPWVLECLAGLQQQQQRGPLASEEGGSLLLSLLLSLAAALMEEEAGGCTRAGDRRRLVGRMWS